jgi:hypothetical protein
VLVEPVCATLHGHLYENRLTGLSRNIYWAITVVCRDIVWLDKPSPCLIMCEWMRCPVTHWHDLDDYNLCRSDDLVEASVYLHAAHQPIRDLKLDLRRINKEAAFVVTLSGVAIIDDAGEMPIATSCRADFEGVVVVPQNLAPPPHTAELATAALEAYMRTSSLAAPVWDGFRYVFGPRTP